MSVLKLISRWASLLHQIRTKIMMDYLVILASVNTGRMESVTIVAMKMRMARQRKIVQVLEESESLFVYGL